MEIRHGMEVVEEAEELGSPRGASAVMGAVPLWIFSQVTVCGCGNMHEYSLLFTVPAAGLAWWGFVVLKRGWGWRVMAMGVVPVMTVTLFVNVGEILWWGCGAWF